MLYPDPDPELTKYYYNYFMIFDNRRINSLVIMSTYYLGQYLMALNIDTIFYLHVKRVHKIDASLDNNQKL